MRRLVLSGLCFCLAALSGAAHAQPFDTQRLFSRGAWSVEMTHDTADGDLWCVAATRNARGQFFALTAFDSGSIALLVTDPGRQLTPRAVRFLVDIDYSRWTIEGTARDIGVSIVMNDAPQAARFIRQLQRGNAVAVLNDPGQRLATFSLRGSWAAITALMTCWNRITPPGGSTDPFGPPSADPFQ